MPSRVFIVCLLTGLLAGAHPAPGQRVESREADSEVKEANAADGAAGAKLDIARVEREIVRLTNEFREREGRSTVEKNEELEAAAQYFADYMARTGRYGHTADGSQPSARAEKHGYDYCLVSENIGYQYSSTGFEADALAKQFTQGWIESPGHRENMLDRDVVDTGVAVARSDDGTYYAVQMFGRPSSMQIEFSVVNKSGANVKYTLAGRSFSLPPRVTRTHQRCRPPELVFNDSGKDGPTRFNPRPGDTYVIETASEGGFNVSRRSEKTSRDGERQ